jgi:hypothetical protein
MAAHGTTAEIAEVEHLGAREHVVFGASRASRFCPETPRRRVA